LATTVLATEIREIILLTSEHLRLLRNEHSCDCLLHRETLVRIVHCRRRRWTGKVVGQAQGLGVACSSCRGFFLRMVPCQALLAMVRCCAWKASSSAMIRCWWWRVFLCVEWIWLKAGYRL
jgi:hypothetical protein